MIPSILAAYGLKKSAGTYFFSKVTDAAGDHWITVHPNGPGTKGQPVLLSKGGEIKGGMGGKFNGMHVSSAHGRQSSSEELLKANQAFSGSVKRLRTGGNYAAEIKRIKGIGASIYGRTPETTATRERYRKVLAWAVEGQEREKSKRECLDFCVQGGFQGGSQSRLPFVYRGLKINDQRLRGTLSRRHKCAKRGECGAPSGGFHHTLHHSIALVNRSPNSRANCGMADDHLVLARVQVSV